MTDQLPHESEVSPIHIEQQRIQAAAERVLASELGTTDINLIADRDDMHRPVVAVPTEPGKLAEVAFYPGSTTTLMSKTEQTDKGKVTTELLSKDSLASTEVAHGLVHKVAYNPVEVGSGRKKRLRTPKLEVYSVIVADKATGQTVSTEVHPTFGIGTLVTRYGNKDGKVRQKELTGVRSDAVRAAIEKRILPELKNVNPDDQAELWVDKNR